MIKKIMLICGTSLLVAMFSGAAMAHDDFNGKIESIPEGNIGNWMIGGRIVPVTDRTELDESDGPLEVGACVEVDISQGWVTEIERDRDSRCD